MKNFPDDYIFIRGCMARKPDFSKEELVDERLTDASLNYGETEEEALRGLPTRFESYAMTTGLKLRQKQGRINKAPIIGNHNHCLLSVITLKDANNLFSHIIGR